MKSVYLLALLLVACSTGGGENPQNVSLIDPDDGKPLTAQQSRVFRETMDSLDLVDKAGRAAETGRNIGVPNADEMKKILRDRNCFIDIFNPGKPDKADFEVSYRFDISGQTCPVSQTAQSVMYHRGIEKSRHSHSVVYDVNDADYAALNDVTHADFRESLDVGYQLMTAATRVSGSGKGRGIIRSKTLGDIQVTSEIGVNILSGRQTNGGVEQMIRFNYDGYVVVLRSKQVFHNRSWTTKYFMNGLVIPNEQFDLYTRLLRLTDSARHIMILRLGS